MSKGGDPPFGDPNKQKNAQKMSPKCLGTFWGHFSDIFWGIWGSTRTFFGHFHGITQTRYQKTFWGHFLTAQESSGQARCKDMGMLLAGKYPYPPLPAWFGFHGSDQLARLGLAWPGQARSGGYGYFQGSHPGACLPSILNRYLDFCLPPGWSKKLSNRTLPFKIGFSRPGTPRNRFVLKFCVVWYLQNRIWLEKCLKSATFDFWPSGVRYLSSEISIRNGSYPSSEDVLAGVIGETF